MIQNTDGLVWFLYSCKCLFLFIKILADILYAAADEGGHVDPHKVETILRVPYSRRDCYWLVY